MNTYYFYYGLKCVEHIIFLLVIGFVVISSVIVVAEKESENEGKLQGKD